MTGRKKKTQEQAIKDLIYVHGTEKYCYKNTTYIGAHEKINVYCKNCKEEFLTGYSYHYSGRGCPVCSKLQKDAAQVKSNEQFLQELKMITETIVPIDVYQGSLTPIYFKCTVCDHEWSTAPSNVTNSSFCSLYPCELVIQNFTMYWSVFIIFPQR